MRKFFYPESAAVIGVSSKPANLGRAIATNLINHHYNGQIHFVGRSGGVVFGQKVHASLAEISEPVDVAVIITPAATVPGFVRECGQKGIKRIIIESGGFAEFDNSRLDLQQELIDAANEYDIRFVGPNGIGVSNFQNGFVTPFASVPRNITKGHISIIAQSGGVGLTYINSLKSEGIGIGKFVSVGNKLNVNECDILEYFIEDDETEIICMYLESLSNGRRLMELARSTDKPILIHKSNTSLTSAKIAASHTASLSADDTLVDEAFRQAGIIRVKRVRQMINLLKILSQPPLKGRKLGVVSRSGGHAVIVADSCDANNLELPTLDRQLSEEIEKHFRGGVIKPQNPLDLGDLFDFSIYPKIAESLIRRDEIDGLLFVHGYRGSESPSARQFFPAAAELCQKYQKPIAICLLVDEDETAYVKKHYGFPVFSSPEDAAACLNASYTIWNWRQNHENLKFPETQEADQKITNILQNEPEGLISSLNLVEEAEIKPAPWQKAFNYDEAIAAADKLSFPVALKIARSDLSHKSDVGGVILNIKSKEELKEALNELEIKLAARNIDNPWPVVIQQMVTEGEEVILGGRQDPHFGPVVLLGLGGIFVEILKDVSLRVAPISHIEASEMIDQLKGHKILEGARGRQVADRKALIDAAVKLSNLLAANPAISEIDLNPVMVLPEGKGLVALDSRVVKKK